MIDRNVQQAHSFAGPVDADPQPELMTPVGLDIVCFRFNPGGLDGEALDALNCEVLMRVHEERIVVPSYTTPRVLYCLRIAMANHRSVQDDFDVLVREVVRIGHEVVARPPAAQPA